MNNLGVALREKGQDDEAMSYFYDSIIAEPRFEMGYNNLAWEFVGKRNLNLALYFFTKALEIKPDYADAIFGFDYCSNELIKIGK
jgi:tetratricopeptide (TPR) repeat protein